MEKGSAESSSTTKINLKLLVDKSKKRVLYAEAGKDFVDFLFGILELPIGAILNLLVERGMETSWPISKVYEAVQTIDPSYLQPNQTKLSLLHPKTYPSNTKQTPMLQQFGCNGQPEPQRQRQPQPHLQPLFGSGFSSAPATGASSQPLFGSGTGSGLFSASTTVASSQPLFGSGFSSASTTVASSLGSGFSSAAATGASSQPLFRSGFSSASTTVASSRKPEMIDGYVKGMVTYMVMDDLTTKPISTISCITNLHTFQIKDVGCLEEKTVEIDIDTALRMVKASFESSNVLTEMFVKPEEISIVNI